LSFCQYYLVCSGNSFLYDSPVKDIFTTFKK